jgi:hypothetical protein
MNTDYPIAHELFVELWSSRGGDEVWLDRVHFHGNGALPSAFAVTDFAAATFAAAGQSALLGAAAECAGNSNPEWVTLSASNRDASQSSI